MGRFNSREVKSYDCLAAYYDELLASPEDFDRWLAYVHQKPCHTVLELAAGSAIFSALLQAEGMEVTALDLSEKMKEAAKHNFTGPYLIKDMTDFDLDKRFDLITCVVDSINYLNESQLTACFACAYRHLLPGGRFIFDSHHPQRLAEFANDYIEEGFLSDNVGYQWMISTEDEDILQHFSFYFDEGMVEENHYQHVFSEELLIEKLEAVGFNVEAIPEFIPGEKMLFIGEKK